jgi:methylglyoxal reductase
MQYRPLGQSGIQASAVAFGGGPIGGGPWGEVDENQAIAAIRSVIDEGINLIDTAPVYGFGTSEELIGKAIAGRRQQVFVATKCGLVWHIAKGDPFHKTFCGKSVSRYLGPESIRYEIEQSLRRLATDYIDLYQTHWQDSTTPITDTMETLLDLKREGKIRAIGVSNCSIEQLKQYQAVGPVDCAQEKYNMLDRRLEWDRAPFCAQNNIAVLAYTPLANGLLTGKVWARREFPDDDLRHDNPQFAPEMRTQVRQMLEEMWPVAARHGLTFSQLAIAWTLRQKGITHALVGVRNERQALENAKAGSAVLSGPDLTLLEEILEKYGMIPTRATMA